MVMDDELAMLWKGVSSFDGELAEQELDRLLTDKPVEEAVIRFLLPLMHQVGDRWEDGTLSIAHEHFVSELLRRRVAILARSAAPTEGKVAVLACPPGERHDLVLACFALLLGRRGWRTRFLGADTPPSALLQACRTVSPDAVVLAATRSTAFEAHTTLLRRLAQHHPLFLGGRGASDEIAAALGAQRLAGNPVTAAIELTAEPRSA